MKKKNDMTHKEACQRFFDQCGKRPSESVMGRAHQRLGISRKKTFYDPKKDEESFKVRLREYREKVAEHCIDDLIFLDESGAVLNLIAHYGYALKGKRVYSPRPVQGGTQISTIGAISRKDLLIAMCYEGTLNGIVFSYFFTLRV